MKQFPSFGSCGVVQPPHIEDMTEREIEANRVEILESSRFAYLLEGKLEDRKVHESEDSTFTFTNAEIGVIGYYIGMCDRDGLYRYLKELVGTDIERVIRKMEEDR